MQEVRVVLQKHGAAESSKYHLKGDLCSAVVFYTIYFLHTLPNNYNHNNQFQIQNP